MSRTRIRVNRFMAAGKEHGKDENFVHRQGAAFLKEPIKAGQLVAGRAALPLGGRGDEPKALSGLEGVTHRVSRKVDTPGRAS